MLQRCRFRVRRMKTMKRRYISTSNETDLVSPFPNKIESTKHNEVKSISVTKQMNLKRPTIQTDVVKFPTASLNYINNTLLHQFHEDLRMRGIRIKATCTLDSSLTSYWDRANSFAKQLDLDLVTEQDAKEMDLDYLFVLDNYMSLRPMKVTGNNTVISAPIYCNFTHPSTLFRLKTETLKKSPLLRACKVKNAGNDFHIIDATGGMGIDAFVLASRGHRVTVIEKNPLIYALLQDGLALHKQDGEISNIMNRITVIHADSNQYIPTIPDNEKPYVIYLDPMYPTTKQKRAASKKEMTILKGITGNPTNTAELIQSAKRKVLNKVVLKRPLKCQFVYNEEPIGSHRGTSVRYDLYAPSIE
eukprot:TRINITY_DN4717_c0_g1_i1.p1 TRINITY_DN4717_c0_g1~~TRINITY_DN4717_c0_g1_i1.p1  ORF type:complete len:360 (+),score=70.96 TRINITY_DN4717_c0_g1_i1:349-1428(+)